ncbi:DUF4153 domain-containing protein [Cereibacter changlensis]|uniref:DUF4153 domain-containing protein n=1 Tax=Cereibacter changlensis TaxID=402884 RepID=UPI0040348441
MDRNMRQRLVMAGIGGLAGLSLHLLLEVLSRHLLPDRAALGLTTFSAIFFAAWLAMAGPLRTGRAVVAALGLGLVVAALLSLTSLRFDRVEAIFDQPMTPLAVVLLSSIPLPFFIALSGPGWRDYPTLFTEAWTVVVRYAAAWLFVGVAWAVLLLSQALLSIVDIRVIEAIIDLDAAPWLITGVTLGLALAVVTELSDLVSPYLILRLLRLLLPLVLGVMALFIAALPFQGLSGLFGDLSVAATLLAMAAAAATLVTTAIDQTDAEAVEGAVMVRAAQGLALILPIPAALAGYAVWLRVAQYGWTPERLFAGLAAVLALAYGLIYALAVLRGAGWMERVRQGNILMALALLALSALWLTPLLNAERISARDQLARFEDGRTALPELDLYALGRWGKPGAEALAQLQARASEPGQEALAERLAGTPSAGQPQLTPAETEAALAALMPVRPAGDTALRDSLLAGLSDDERGCWLERCRNRLADGRPGCVMLTGDFWPETAGAEAIVLLRDGAEHISTEGLAMVDGLLQRRAVSTLTGLYPQLSGTVIADLLDAAPAPAPVPLNGLRLGGEMLFLAP